MIYHSYTPLVCYVILAVHSVGWFSSGNMASNIVNDAYFCVQDQFCYINNTCYSFAENKPDNADFVCDPARNLTTWTDRNGRF